MVAIPTSCVAVDWSGGKVPLAVEIYPRCFYPRKLTKTEAYEREAVLREHYPELAPEFRQKMAACTDAFDAGVSALEMMKRRHSVARLRQRDGMAGLEGCIWDGNEA